ncbi:hypothetical protein TNCV_4270001 [Trichonephila clavipes]|nr:hypothetical protein TNCV_4270001 [Trichonephila clavipes]
MITPGQGHLKACANWTPTSSRSRLSLNKIIIRITSKVNRYFRLYSPNNLEFWTICQLTTCDDRRPCLGLGLPPYIIITHSVKKVAVGRAGLGDSALNPLSKIKRSVYPFNMIFAQTTKPLLPYINFFHECLRTYRGYLTLSR